MRQLYNRSESIFLENMVTNNAKNYDRSQGPLLCGYFIINAFNQIIEISPNFSYFLSDSYYDFCHVEELLNEHFNFMEKEHDNSNNNKLLTVEHKSTGKKFKIKIWNMQEDNKYYYFEEIKIKNAISETTKFNFHYLFDLMPLGIVAWDDNKNIRFTNTYFNNVLLTDKESIVGSHLHDFLLTLNIDLNYVKEQMDKLKKSDLKHVVGKCVITNKNGQEMYLEYYIIGNIYKDCNLLIFKDETELTNIFEHIRRSDNLNVVGQLAAGIAHEIRNPMTSIKGFIDLIRPELDAKNKMYYEVITVELERLDLIINEFLFLSKPKTLDFAKYSLVEIIKSTVELMQGQCSLHNIVMEVNYPLNDMFINCNQNEIKKVIVNLVKNAQEVIEKNGRIVIDFSTKDNYHSFSIKDNGCGMSEEQISKIGSAFYTTKEKGTGLGLYVTNKIVDEHGGKISINSQLNIGTTFTVDLPKYVTK